MTTQTITLELPDPLYRSAQQISEITQRPIEEIVQESLEHTLPPLGDISTDEAQVLARMSTFDDSSLWEEANIVLPSEVQAELQALLDRQSAGELQEADEARLRTLMDEYGRLLVRRSHAWLLLARRGYSVPVQQQ